MTPRAQTYLNVALCILLWASFPLVLRNILAELTYAQMIFWSTASSVIALLALTLWQGKLAQLASFSLRSYAQMGILGFLAAVLEYILLYGAFAPASEAEGFILDYTWPILITLLAVPLLGERLTPARLLAMLLCFGGAVMILTLGRMVELSLGFANMAGNLLALGSALVFAVFSLLGKRSSFELTIAVLVYFAAALVYAAAMVVFTGGTPLPSASIWGWILYNGLLVNGISYLFWFKALKQGDTFVVSNLMYLIPAVSLLFVWLFFGESAQLSAFSGLLLIAGGLLIAWPRRAGRARGRSPIP